MPYIIKKVKNGFKVCKDDDKSECFSKKPLTETKAKKQKTAIILSELRRTGKITGGLRPLFARSGGKNLLKKTIVKHYFPENYENMIYVEPFFGGGSIFMFKEPSKKEVINDIDPDIKIVFEGFKKYDHKEIEDYVKKKLDFKNERDRKPKSQKDKFFQTIWLIKNSFLSLKKTPQSSERVNPNYKDIKDRLKDAIALNKSYQDVIKKYDSADTFFYLDPPYEDSEKQKIYKFVTEPFKYVELEDILSKIKGKFLLSINDSPNIRKIFKKFNIYEEYTRYGSKIKSEGGQPRKIKELLITNYKVNKKGSGKREELIEKAEEKVGKIPERYVPKSLSISDLRKQLKSIIEGVKRPQLKSFKSEKSDWTKKAEEYFGNDRSLNDIVEKLGETPKRKKEILKGLKEINKKGEAAYYTSGSRPNQTPQSWGIARVYSVLFGGASRKIDKDIVEKYNIPLLGREKIEVMPQETDFEKELKEIGLNPDLYLKAVKIKAKNYGLNPELLTFSKNPDKKLSYDGVDFGATGYKDFLIYNFLESKGEVPEGTAIEKRNAYRSRAEGIQGNWKQEKTSPNNLAINILW